MKYDSGLCKRFAYNRWDVQVPDIDVLYVDMFKIGKLNHFKAKKEPDWKEFRIAAIRLLKSLNKEFYSKTDLLE